MTHFLLTDLETTGLDARECVPIEIAVRGLVTPGPREMFRYHSLIALPSWSFFLDPGALKMHQASGLWAEILTAKKSLVRVEDELLAVIGEHVPETERPVVMGNSVHFDVEFLRVHMPKFAARLHYRILDVTSVVLFAELFGHPMVMDKRRGHRSQDDVEDTWLEALALSAALGLGGDR